MTSIDRLLMRLVNWIIAQTIRWLNSAKTSRSKILKIYSDGVLFYLKSKNPIELTQDIAQAMPIRWYNFFIYLKLKKKYDKVVFGKVISIRWRIKKGSKLP